ncbi:hypothetical protein BV20DRAFT_1054952 [Pilatotrama ljubarskyi]|nr:hypothetical protein BV20DRAFT_1054952 [Pilatotrama ljubarskyi]
MSSQNNSQPKAVYYLDRWSSDTQADSLPPMPSSQAKPMAPVPGSSKDSGMQLLLQPDSPHNRSLATSQSSRAHLSSSSPAALPAADAQARLHSTTREQPGPPLFLEDLYSSDSNPELTAPVMARPSPPFASSQHLQSDGTRDKGKKRAITESNATPTAATGRTKRAKAATRASSPALPVSQGRRKNGSTGKKYTGRQAGSSNYTEDDLKTLLRSIRQFLPIGQNGWDAVARQFNEWAILNGRPKREVKPLKAKYDNLVRLASEKPTGKATVPWYLEKAGKIERRIQERSNTGELDDDEGNAVVEDGGQADADSDDEDAQAADDAGTATSDSGEELLGGAAAKARGGASLAGARRNGEQPGPILQGVRASNLSNATLPATRRAQTQELFGAISAALDPSARDAREDARFARRLAQDEIARLTQENRDLRLRNDTLTDRVQELSAGLQDQRAEVTRLRGRIEAYELMQSLMARHGMSNPLPSSWHAAQGSPQPSGNLYQSNLPSCTAAPSSPSASWSHPPPDHSRLSTPGPSTPRHRAVQVHNSAGSSEDSALQGLNTLATAASDSSRSVDSASVTITVSPHRRRQYRTQA